MSRHNKSASVWIHHSYVGALLKASGEGNVFTKVADADKHTMELHLLWLPEGTQLSTAKSMPAHPAMRGLARKGAQKHFRLALRFTNEDELVEYANAQGIEYTKGLQRWSLYGLQLSAGPVGA
eukprot:5687109-Amphidinium_carterae.2